MSAAQLKPQGAEPADTVRVDAENPWLGLSSYGEETRAYFHGRDEETAELARRVQRKLLTVLFGQSGLGKTSLIRAGLVPRLRTEGYCPVYVRIDYSPDSPSPSEQIKQAIFRASAGAGHWTRPGSAVEGESLWEFLHHRGDLLRDSSGRMLLPLLIFDQFEEIFTLGQADDAGRRRARTFLEDLADLVENRPPAALERRLDQDETDAEQFDFARADYRVLIALREDYLAHLESVKDIMPSITQNRMRLARMTGAQALSAVIEPGGRLVSREVAESIVRFVAGGSELATAEVEPSLLSLVCRELNTVRRGQGRAEISADLLAGSRETILSEFYERALADQPPGVRRVIEDELLTESGYRESLAEERVQKALAAAGAGPDALATLVDRRLLRIEERLDVRRVELTHDVLCGIVRTSRDLRHEREARDEAQRLLAAQQAREAETHRTLVRTRIVAAVCAGLMLVAAASAVFGWVSMRRARTADEAAQHASQMAERARNDAEKLVGFLIEDFYAELEPTGRLETMGKLAHMAVSYYDSLPPELMTPRTQIYRAMALVREGSAQSANGNLDAAARNFSEAKDVFERLRAAGDHGEDVVLGLALTLFARSNFVISGGGVGGSEAELKQAAELLRPLAHADGASRRVRRQYAEILNYVSHVQPKEQGIQSCEEARTLLAGLGALDLTDLGAASAYADVSDSEARHAMALGRLADAEKLEHETYDIAEKVLARRPGDLRSMANRALAANVIGALAARRGDYREAILQASSSARAGEDYVRFNPADLTAWVYVDLGQSQVAAYELEMGRVSQALAQLRATSALDEDPRSPGGMEWLLLQTRIELMRLESRMGHRAAAQKILTQIENAVDLRREQLRSDPERQAVLAHGPALWKSLSDFALGDFERAYGESVEVDRRLAGLQISPDNVSVTTTRESSRRGALRIAILSALATGRFADAEALARRRMKTRPNQQDPSVDPLDEVARDHVMLAHALAAQGRPEEARTALGPALARFGSQRQSGLTASMDRSYALYVSALTQPDDTAGRARKDTDLSEARSTLARLSNEARQLSDVRELSGWVARAR